MVMTRAYNICVVGACLCVWIYWCRCGYVVIA